MTSAANELREYATAIDGQYTDTLNPRDADRLRDIADVLDNYQEALERIAKTGDLAQRRAKRLNTCQ